MTTVYTTCPASYNRTPREFREEMLWVANLTEAAGCRGLLVYSDNTLVDPWVAAQLMIDRTEKLVPLVAVQPLYMHPFSAARLISTIGYMYARQLDLNFVSGGFAGHLKQLGCTVEHDGRYKRLVEYGQTIMRLLTHKRPLTYLGDSYALHRAMVHPELNPDLLPGIFVSGASDACVEAQRELKAVRLAYPHWVENYSASDALAGTGMRVGIIARETSEEAWRIARTRFPLQAHGEQLHDIAARRVESEWHRSLSRDAWSYSGRIGAYWLYPFRVYKTFCPYLVGSHSEVADLLARYLRLGVSAIILDVPEEEADVYDAMQALRLAELELANA